MATHQDREPPPAIERDADGHDEEGPAPERADDEVVDEMERESFPASDSPSTWAGPDAG